MTTTRADTPVQRPETAGLARGGVANLAGAAAAAVAGFAFTAVVARGLDPAEAGAFFAATTVFGIGLTVAKLGTSTGLVYWLARLRAAGVPRPLRRCLRLAAGPVLVASLVVGGVMFVAAPVLATATGTAPLRVLAVLLPFAALSDTLLAATRGYRAMAPTVVVEKLVRPLLQLLLLLGALGAAAAAGAAIRDGGTTTAVTLAWAVPYLATALLAARWLSIVDARSAPAEPAGPEAGSDDRLARAFWMFTGPRAGASLAQLALQRLDVLLVAGFLGFPAAALYTVATRFVVVGQLANAAIATAVEPRLAESLSRGDTAAARQLYQTATGWLVLLAWPLYLSMVGFAPLYLQLFGSRYGTGEAVTVVIVMAVAMLVATACGAVDVMLAMAGRTTWNLGNVLLALGINVGLNLLLLPRLGIVGAALAWAAAVLAKNLVPLGQLAVALRLHPFGRGTLLAAGLTLTCFGALPLVVVSVAGPSLANAVGALACGVAWYAVAVIWLRGPLAVDSFAEGRS